VAFPLKVDDADKGDDKEPRKKTEDEKRGLKHVVLSLDGKAHDLEIGYVAEAPVWRPSYRLVVEKNGEGYLQAWGVVQNLSGEDWTNVRLSLVAGAPLAFEAQLGEAIIPQRPVVTDRGEVIASVPRGDTSLGQGRQPDRDHDALADVDDRPSAKDELKEEDAEESKPDSSIAGNRRSAAGKKAGPSGGAARQRGPKAPAADAQAQMNRPAAPPPPPPPPPKPLPPPPPTAPPLPFSFMGRYEEGTTRIILLVRDERIYTVSEGEVIDNTYRVERLTGGQLELTYLPLNIKQTISAGGT